MVTARGGQEGAPQTEAFGIDPMFKLEGAGGRKIGNERSAVQAVGIGDRSAAEGLLELVNIHSQPRGERSNWPAYRASPAATSAKLVTPVSE